MEYTFHNPGRVLIRTRTSDQETTIDTTKETWYWKDGGIKYKINWSSLDLHPTLKEIVKAYIFFSLQNHSPITVYSNQTKLFRELSKSSLGRNFPWSEKDASTFLSSQYGTAQFSNFRVFYKWCVKRSMPGFFTEIEIKLSDKAGRKNSYQKIHLNEINLCADDEIKIWNAITSSSDIDWDYFELRDNIILHLGFELGPRPIQLYSLDNIDLEFYSENPEEKYYTLWLPMAKKRSVAKPEKRQRRITNALGSKIEKLIALNEKMHATKTSALFLNNELKRLAVPQIIKIVTNELTKLGFQKGDGLMVLRHHLGQSLADQGASAESISEILGHNSTVPARAYISATPDIATIKSKALGKNGTYLNIMKMMLTGDIVAKNQVSKERWVKGMVGSQYIGGIGACGLKESTPCPKNPVYSCYTCNKFHPFQDGTHDSVRIALQKQAQFFVDTASSGNDIEQNRAVSQLELTIHAVDAVVERCKSEKRTL
jgi:site-specific recombinase XerD